MISLNNEDLRLLESLRYQESLSPKYDDWMDCLIWDDEWPKGLSRAGYEIIEALLTARSLKHDPKKKERMLKDGLDVKSLERLWDDCFRAKLPWPGFRRVQPTREILKFLSDAKLQSAERGEF